ncbi:uncharacterized protein LOC134777677 [Penaeus indicus]|uniref:uncharacterized protein LOC134777677 n=1 Tax=Penaeus indicus TaxID=29960 RepID=UPI00300CAB33
MSRRCLLSLLALHVAAACQEVNLTCKTPLPTSEGADGVEALVGVRPQEGDWGALFEVEREDRVVAKISLSLKESKTGSETAYNDRLAIQCGNETPLVFDSPWPTAWLSGEAKCLLFRVSDSLIDVLQKKGSSEIHIGSGICKINLSNVSFSASNLPHLPAPTLSLGCADGELKNSTEAESGKETTKSGPALIAGLCVLLPIAAAIATYAAWFCSRRCGRRSHGVLAVRLSALLADEEALRNSPDEGPSVRQRPPMPSPRTVFLERRQLRLSSSTSTSSSVLPLLSSSPHLCFDSLSLSFAADLPTVEDHSLAAHCAQKGQEIVTLRRRPSNEEVHTYERITFMDESLY